MSQEPRNEGANRTHWCPCGPFAAHGGLRYHRHVSVHVGLWPTEVGNSLILDGLASFVVSPRAS